MARHLHEEVSNNNSMNTMAEQDIDKMAASEDVASESLRQDESKETQQPDGEEKKGTSEAEKKQPTDTEKLAQAEKDIAELKDRLLRQMAEFDNYRKRTIKEKSELILSGGQRVLESLLPVLDDLERAQASMSKATDVDTLRQGVELIIDKLTKTLSTHGLKKIETEGAPFDTDYHEAVAITPAQDEAQKNHVIDCVQPGYTLGEKVIRHAKVVVGQ